MAKLVGGPLGSYKGKAGGTIGSSWKGIAVVKAMPLSVANPNTVAQQAHREMFAACIAAARLLLSDLITIYWNPFAKKMSGFNAFVKQNIDCFATGSLTVPADFYAARGILMGVKGLSVVAAAGVGTIQADWTDNSGVGDALATDLARLVVFNETKEYWKVFSPAKDREDALFQVTDEDIEEADVLDCYFFFIRPDISKISDSAYKHVVVIAEE